MPRAQKISPKKRGLLNGYRSGLEDAVSQDLAKRGVPALYEQAKIKYERPVTLHTYTGDWIVRRDRDEIIFPFSDHPQWYTMEDFWAEHFMIEGKGYFKPEDRKKHLLIQDQHPMVDIRFLFTKSKSPIRKGSKTTYGMWCENHGFIYADKIVPDEWFD